MNCENYKKCVNFKKKEVNLCETCGTRNCATQIIEGLPITHCSSFTLKQPNNKKLCLGCEHSKDIDCTKRPITNIAFFCERYLKKQPVIYVPEKVQFDAADDSTSIGLLFNKGKQAIYWDGVFKVFQVSTPCTPIIKPKLFPCEKGDIGVGEWGFANDFEDGDFKEKGRYFLNIGETSIGKTFTCILHDTFIQPVNFSYNYWWKVVE